MNEAIAKIENAAVQAPNPVPIPPEDHPRGHGQVLVVKDGYRVHELNGPMRGKREHVFHDLESLAAWLNRHAQGKEEQAEILMDAVFDPEDVSELGAVTAYLEPKAADGDRVRCEIAKNPVFLAWHAILGNNINQVQLVEHLRCYRDSVDEAGTALLAALQQLKITSGGSSEVQVGNLGEVKFLQGDRRTEPTVTLPPEIEVETSIFDGIQGTYHLRIFVSMRFDEQAIPIFRLTCPGLAIVLREALHDAKGFLEEKLSDGFLVGFGVAAVEEIPACRAE